MKSKDNISFDTKLIHASLHDEKFGSLAFPIYQTSTFIFDNAQQGGRRFALEEEGYIYSRLGNPSTTTLELKMAALENSEAALAVSSGMAAISTVFTTLLACGDHVISDNTIYGCTHELLKNQLKRFGVSVDFIDVNDEELLNNTIRPNTKMIFFETPCNPTLKIIDIEKIATFANNHKILSVIDNTVATPYLTRPIDLGIDIVVHSATKYLNGHGDVIAGFICASKALIDEFRFKGLKDITGAVMSPFDAFLINRGLKTLHLRMQKHSENALKVAKFLDSHKAVQNVYYPGLESHERHLIAKKQMNGMYSGLIAIEINGGYNEAVKIINNLKIFKLAVSLGDAESLIQHPASMTHSPYTKEERMECGIHDNLIRISIGLECADDLIADLQEQLDNI